METSIRSKNIEGTVELIGMGRMSMDKSEVIDIVEGLLAQHETIECPLIHSFTPGFYIRQIFMPTGTLLTSKIHKTKHAYYISKGKVSVWIDKGNEVTLEEGFWGMTEAGTRRILYIHEDCIWTTFHANEDDCEDVLEIEHRIIEEHDNPNLSEEIKEKFNLNGYKYKKQIA